MPTAAQPSQRTCVKPPLDFWARSLFASLLLYSPLWTFTSSHPCTLNSSSLTRQDLGILLGLCFHKQAKKQAKRTKTKSVMRFTSCFASQGSEPNVAYFPVTENKLLHMFCWIFLLFWWEGMLVSVTVKREILYALSQVYILNHENWPYISYKKTSINSKKTKQYCRNLLTIVQ